MAISFPASFVTSSNFAAVRFATRMTGQLAQFVSNKPAVVSEVEGGEIALAQCLFSAQ